MDPLEKLMGATPPEQPREAPSSTSGSRSPSGSRPPPSSNSSGTRPSPGISFSTPEIRLKRKENNDGSELKAKREKNVGADSSPKKDSFAPFSKIPVRMNSWRLDITEMDEIIQKVLFKTTMIMSNGKKFDLADGIVAVSGDVNRQVRRRALCLIFQYWFRQHTHLFMGKNPSVAAYDAAETFYVGKSNMPNEITEMRSVLSESDFSTEDWEIVSRIFRRKDTKFEVTVKSTGHLYTRGPNALSVENRSELTRCLECVTNQIVHTNEYLLYSSGIYSVKGGTLSEPDGVTEIKSGFSKVTKVITGVDDTKPQAVMTVDTAKSAFFKSTSMLKFFHAKMEEAYGRGGGGRGGRGSYRGNFGGGRGGYGGDRSGGYGDRRDSYGRDRRESYGGNRDGHRGDRDRYRDDRRDDRRDDSRDYRRDDRRDDRRDGRHDDHGGSRRDRQNDDRTRARFEIDYDHEAIKNLERDFKNGRITNRMLENISRALKGLECIPTHLKDVKANRGIIIDSVVDQSAMAARFEKEIEGVVTSVTVQDHFKKTHGLTIQYPNLPLIASKRRREVNFYPMEFLFIVPGQRIKQQKMTPDIQQHMTGQNSSLPLQHIRQNETILRDYLKMHGGNRYMDGFKIKFESKDPITMSAQLLAPPYIKFKPSQPIRLEGKGVRFPTNDRTTFVKPADLKSLLIINFDHGFRGMDDFESCLNKQFQLQGIRKDRDYICRKDTLDANDTDGLLKLMKKAMKKGFTLVIAICAEKKPEIHDTLKYFEEKLGQVTLQLSTETCNKMSRGGGNRQTVDNVLRKLNNKCGGTNFFVEVPEQFQGKPVCRNAAEMTRKLFQDTQFIGFEMSHTGARTKYEQQESIVEGDPTCVGVCYTLKQSTELGGFSYFQDTRVHKLLHLEEHFETCIKEYKRAVGNLPKTIVIYRVGSGEGDYEKVRKEVEEMRKAAERYEEGYIPKFLVVLSQRNSHVRIFPEYIRDGGKAIDQNVQSGTCVDTFGSAHGLMEFILCCQTPMIGTVRPTRYTVIVNDTDWTKNELMNVTYYLSFGHQVSYAPPAVPNVLYGAANMAKRGHNNYKTFTRIGEMKEVVKRVMDSHRDVIDPSEMNDLVTTDCIDNISKMVNKMTIPARNFWA